MGDISMNRNVLKMKGTKKIGRKSVRSKKSTRSTCSFQYCNGLSKYFKTNFKAGEALL